MKSTLCLRVSSVHFSLCLCVLVAPFASCSNINPGEFINTDVKLKALEGGCEQIKPGIHMTGNIAGERYVLQDCLKPGFSATDIKTEREGDTIQLSWPSGGAGAKPIEMSIDVDANPRYNYINLNGTISRVVAAE